MSRLTRLEFRRLGMNLRVLILDENWNGLTCQRLTLLGSSRPTISFGAPNLDGSWTNFNDQEGSFTHQMSPITDQSWFGRRAQAQHDPNIAEDGAKTAQYNQNTWSLAIKYRLGLI